jgi:RNA ligase-like protein
MATTRPPHRLLSRDDFREGVFARDKGCCVICGAPALDAHHILERKLWSDGGYYLANGASLCGEHHMEAEQTTLSCEQVREAAGILEPLLPEHLPLDERYDKWGNPILKNGQRLRGEIFFDKGAQTMLASVLGLFTNRVKPHRTLHLPWSRSVGDDDRVLANLDAFAGEEVVVTAKMDGRGTTMMRDLVYAKSIAGVSGPGTSRIKALHATIAQHLPEDWRLCGEDMQVEHSIAYRNLRAYFYLFAAWDERNVARSWDETLELATILDLVPVPVLYRGPWVADEIRALGEITELEGDPLEGYVVRVTRAFSAGETPRVVGKFVRAGHNTMAGRKKRTDLAENQLAPGAGGG